MKSKLVYALLVLLSLAWVTFFIIIIGPLIGLFGFNPYSNPQSLSAAQLAQYRLWSVFQFPLGYLFGFGALTLLLDQVIWIATIFWLAGAVLKRRTRAVRVAILLIIALALGAIFIGQLQQSRAQAAQSNLSAYGCSNAYLKPEGNPLWARRWKLTCLAGEPYHATLDLNTCTTTVSTFTGSQTQKVQGCP